MGTNYFHITNLCNCCGRYDERHIGKSFVMFQGYRPDPDWPDDPTPYLTSWRHWRDHLRAGGEVGDEYGRKWHTEEFIEAVEDTDPKARRRQYDAVHEQPRGYNAAFGPNGPIGWVEHDWIDGDGFSFCDLEFT